MKLTRIFSVVLLASSINTIGLNIDPDFTFTGGCKDKYIKDGISIGNNAAYFLSIGVDLTDYKGGCEMTSFVEDNTNDLMSSSMSLYADYDIFHDGVRIYCGAELYANNDLSDAVPADYYDLHFGIEAPLFLRSSLICFGRYSQYLADVEGASLKFGLSDSCTIIPKIADGEISVSVELSDKRYKASWYGMLMGGCDEAARVLSDEFALTDMEIEVKLPLMISDHFEIVPFAGYSVLVDTELKDEYKSRSLERHSFVSGVMLQLFF